MPKRLGLDPRKKISPNRSLFKKAKRSTPTSSNASSRETSPVPDIHYYSSSNVSSRAASPVPCDEDIVMPHSSAFLPQFLSSNVQSSNIDAWIADGSGLLRSTSRNFPPSPEEFSYSPPRNLLPTAGPSSSTTTTTFSTFSSSTTITTTTTTTAAILNNPIPKGPGERRSSRHSLVNDYDKIDVADSANETRLLNKGHFNKIVENLVCGECFSPFEYTYAGCGAGGYTKWNCSCCGLKFDTKFQNVIGTSNKISAPDFQSIHMATVNDMGFSGYQRFLAGLHLKPLNKSQYYRFCDIVYDVQSNQFHEMQEEALERVKTFYRDVLGIEPDDDGLLPIFASFDTTYARRGFHSLFASGYLVEAFTGEVLFVSLGKV